jgi:hypothetical protein
MYRKRPEHLPPHSESSGSALSQSQSSSLSKTETQVTRVVELDGGRIADSDPSSIHVIENVQKYKSLPTAGKNGYEVKKLAVAKLRDFLQCSFHS